MSDPIDTVNAIYQAFGRGDVPAILERLAPEVQWDPPADTAGQRAGVPTLQPRRGRDEVAAFFQALGALQFHAFAVREVFGSGDAVAALIDIDFSVTATGRRVHDDEVHLWHFDAQGRVARFRHCVDTAKHIWAWGGAQAW